MFEENPACDWPRCGVFLSPMAPRPIQNSPRRKLRDSAIVTPIMAAKTVSSRSNHVSLRNPRAMIVNINSAKMTRGMSPIQVGISVGSSAATRGSIPAARSWRTLTSQPRASPHSRRSVCGLRGARKRASTAMACLRARRFRKAGCCDISAKPLS